MRLPATTVTALLVFVLLAATLLSACSGSSDETDPIPLLRPENTAIDEASSGDGSDHMTITIGNLTDITGPSSGGQETVNQALKDVAQYYNDRGLIPGATLKVIEYDGQLDPSRDIPGYEWLMSKGSDVLWSGVPGTPVTLKATLNKDETVMFIPAGDIEAVEPPGYIFNTAAIPQHEAYTLLRWLAENDPDFPADRPAKIGGAGWRDAYSESFLQAIEECCAAYPHLFEWQGAHLNNYSFNWSAEVEALRECDYVYPGSVPTSFIKQYRDAGCTAKLIGTEVQAAFLGLIRDGDLWDEVDGMVLIRTARWWNEDDEIVRLAKTTLHEYREASAQEIMRSGCGYLGACQANQMMSIIADAVAAVGAANFSSDALYDAATSFSMTIDGIERYSFDETKRISANYFGIYEAVAVEEDLVRADPQWYPVITEP